ncbi:MATE family efflux transporter [Streptococcus sp. DD13]|uniref:MATE family efflux transporter n=1 Tax=Streptococcus sp. DD13 TaxID=1777881 RepID=UPI000797C020|nr:MATE family efflux transporter [Streptococcus sp. DD13]KXT78246.1 Multi antimicrobial extrusion (MATE) family transporter [Streptococcus sp. DD13]
MYDLKKILHLAIPATLDNLLQTLVSFVDAWMIAQIGLVAVTAVGLANTILSVYQALFIAVGIAATTLIAQSLGQKKVRQLGRYSCQIFLVTLVLSGLLGIVSLLLGSNLLRLVGASGPEFPQALVYFFWVGGGSIFLGLSTVFAAMIRATGDAKTPLVIGLFVNLINIALDAILIFGIEPFPALGVLGTALGTVLARLFGSLLLFIAYNKHRLASLGKDSKRFLFAPSSL